MPEKKYDFESIYRKIEDLTKECESDNADLKVFLSTILIRYNDTKERIDYLKKHISDSKHLEYLEVMDDNVEVTQRFYKLALTNLNDSYHKIFDKMKELIESVNAITEAELKEKKSVLKSRKFNLFSKSSKNN